MFWNLDLSLAFPWPSLSGDLGICRIESSGEVAARRLVNFRMPGQDYLRPGRFRGGSSAPPWAVARRVARTTAPNRKRWARAFKNQRHDAGACNEKGRQSRRPLPCQIEKESLSPNQRNPADAARRA